MLFGEKFIRDSLSDVTILNANFPQDPQFSIDSRTVKSGEIFVALQGARVDGHDFIEQVLKNGASGLVIASSKKSLLDKIEASLLKDKLIIIVPDPEQALITLAAKWRKQFDYPVVGITGSVGKTSTKETIAKILRTAGMNFLATQGNQNTKIGISLNILKMRPQHQVAIFEVGINKRGEMAKLADLLQPTTGVITYIGHSHMEGLGSVDDIANEKRALFKNFTDQSIGIINGDQAILTGVSYHHPVMKFGSKLTNQIQSRKIKVNGSSINFLLSIYREKYPITLPHTHMGAVSHALAATAVAYLLHVPVPVILEALQKEQSITGRFQVLDLSQSKGKMINDCYNASPESMKAALTAFNHYETRGEKIAVLGDMLELGANSPFWHRQLGRYLRKLPTIKRLILVGSHVEWTRKACPPSVVVEQAPNWQEAAKLLQSYLQDETCVLVKGSLGMGLQNLVNSFTNTQK